MDRPLQPATEKLRAWPRPEVSPHHQQRAVQDMRRELGWDLLRAARKPQSR